MRIILLVLCIFITTPSYSIRAGLDFTFKITINGNTKVVTCDICNYDIEGYDMIFQTRSVHASENYITLIFLSKKLDKDSVNKIDFINATKSDEKSFIVLMHKLIKLKEGQTIKLQGYPISMELIAATGGGCPAGVMC